ncbi:MAG: DUF3592 domain-containing protein [Luteolibacter sp.]
MFRKSPAAAKDSKEMAGGCLSLFGLPFFLAGLFLSGLYFSGYGKWWQARSWEQVPCVIDSAELKESHDSDSDSSRATATYHYRYAGRDYRGDKVSLYGGSDNIGSFQHDAHRELSSRAKGEKERTFVCYVNPSNPGESVLYRTLRWQMQAFVAVFALTFPAIGTGLLFAGLLGIRETKTESRLREKYPDQPWKWKAAWAGPAISEEGSLGRKVLFAYTFWFWLVVLPLLASVIMTGVFPQNPSSAFLIAFPLIGIAPTWFALRGIRRQRAIGKTSLELKKWPASPGGVLLGSILIEKHLPSRGNAQATIECRKSITRGSGEDRKVTTEKVWSHQEIVRLDAIPRGLDGLRIPFSFSLPPDAPETSLDSSDGTKFDWKLTFNVPGTPVRSVYEIPVFHTGEKPELPDRATLVSSIREVPLAELPALLAARRILATFDGNGLPKSIICPPGRNLPLLISLIIFDVIWTAVAVLLTMKDAPLLFRIVWPVSAAVIWISIIRMALHKRTVTLDHAGMTVSNQLGPVIWTRTYTKRDITGFSHDTNMSSGNTSFYRVRLESVLGKKDTLVDSITESNTAAALAAQLDQWKKSEL